MQRHVRLLADIGWHVHISTWGYTQSQPLATTRCAHAVLLSSLVLLQVVSVVNACLTLSRATWHSAPLLLDGPSPWTHMHCCTQTSTGEDLTIGEDLCPCGRVAVQAFIYASLGACVTEACARALPRRSWRLIVAKSIFGLKYSYETHTAPGCSAPAAW